MLRLSHFTNREIIVNAILPIALLYARIFKDKAVREGTLECTHLLLRPKTIPITR